MKLLVFAFLLLPACLLAQLSCPPNIGFETGDFQNWQPYTGHVLDGGTIVVAPALGNHELFSNKNVVPLDPYGNFPVESPDGSQYCVKLGHSIPDTKADQLTYKVNVPSNTNNFSILFSYAVVLQFADHDSADQPRFTVKVFNENTNAYIECSSFDFVSAYSQPDFLISQKDRNVYYKPWSSASINLGAYAGNTLRLEFSVNDCSEGGHFAYAYFDVMEKCSNAVTGNIICPGVDNITLRAPEGFASYQWYTGTFSDSLGEGINYTATTPNIGDKFAVVLEPYSYLGCRDTFYTTIISSADTIQLVVKDSITGCGNEAIDLTQPNLTAGSSPSLSYEYYLDADATTPITNPANIKASGIYYIRASNASGCTKTRAVMLNIASPPEFEINDPAPVKYPATVNLGLVSNNQDLRYTFWYDKELTKPVINPSQLNESGIYYVKGTNSAGCYSVKTVEVKIAPLVSVPNTFSPNGDGRNDRFTFNAAGKFKEVTFFKVYNRWGQEVYSSTDVNGYWDGTFKGKPVENGTYVWILRATDWLNEIHTARGSVTLIR